MPQGKKCPAWDDGECNCKYPSRCAKYIAARKQEA